MNNEHDTERLLGFLSVSSYMQGRRVGGSRRLFLFKVVFERISSVWVQDMGREPWHVRVWESRSKLGHGGEGSLVRAVWTLVLLRSCLTWSLGARSRIYVGRLGDQSLSRVWARCLA